jgi:multicomponent Na+:H+ antiporter subunit F
MTFLDVMAGIVVIAAAINGLSLLRGNNRWNRLLAYNILAGKITIAIVLLAASSNNGFYLDIAVIYALLGFIGVTALSDYLYDKGRS